MDEIRCSTHEFSNPAFDARPLAVRHATTPARGTTTTFSFGFSTTHEGVTLKKHTAVAAAAALVLAATLVPAARASADEGHNPTIVASAPVNRPTGLSEIASVFVEANGTSYQTDSYSGSITKTTAAGVVTTLVAAHSGYLSGLTAYNGVLYYFDRVPAQAFTDPPDIWLMSVPVAGGTPKQVVHYSDWQLDHEPDAANVYGFYNTPQSCLDQFLGLRGLEPGIEYGSYADYSYATQTVATASGIYLSDSGRNSVLKVTYTGAVSVVAVLPPEPAIVADQAFLDRNYFPQCALGKKYAPRPAPSGITQGPDGNFYVTTLPNGYPGTSLALKGGIYRVNPATGVSKRIIGSLKAPTGISATPSGTLYVAEGRGGTDGAGGISVVRVNAAIARPLTNLAGASSVRYVKDKLYIPTSNALKVVTLTYK